MFTATPEATTTNTLGPATVLAASTRPNHVLVRLRDESEVEARMALAYSYEPALDDLLLVIGQNDEHFVIGVLAGRGKTIIAAQGPMQISVDGDLDLQSTTGRISIQGAQGVLVRGKELELHSERMQIQTKTIFQRATDVFYWFQGLFHTQCKRRDTTVEGASYERAQTTIVAAEENVKVIGKHILLG